MNYERQEKEKIEIEVDTLLMNMLKPILEKEGIDLNNAISQFLLSVVNDDKNITKFKTQYGYFNQDSLRGVIELEHMKRNHITPKKIGSIEELKKVLVS